MDFVYYVEAKQLGCPLFACLHAWMVDNPNQLLVILRIFNCSIKSLHCKYLLSNYLN